MISTALVLSLVLSGADDLAPAKVNGLSVRLPAAWAKKAMEDGSVRYDAPSGDGWLELAVYKVDPARDAKLCLDQLLEALGAEGWERLTVGASPAAKKLTVASATGADEEGEVNVEGQSTMHIGCNGKTKWVLTVVANAAKRARYDGVAAKVLSSIRYGK